MSDDLENFDFYSSKAIKARFAENLKTIEEKNLLKAQTPVIEAPVTKKTPSEKLKPIKSPKKSKIKPPENNKDSNINVSVVEDSGVDYNPKPAQEKSRTVVSHKSKRLSSGTSSDDIIVETVVAHKRTRTARGQAPARGRGQASVRGSGQAPARGRGQASARGKGQASARGRNQAPANALRTRLGFLIQPDSPPMPKMVFSGFEVDQKKEVRPISGIDDEEINPEISIKIQWKSMDIKRFKLRKFQTFSSLFEELSKLENVTPEEILLIKNEKGKPKFIQPTDTPDSLNVLICDILEGGVITIPRPQATAEATPVLKKNEILLKFQDINKKVMSLSMNRSDKMKVVMVKCSEKLEKHFTDVRFIFDGDEIDPEDTAEDLDFEGGEVIDIKVSVQ